MTARHHGRSPSSPSGSPSSSRSRWGRRGWRPGQRLEAGGQVDARRIAAVDRDLAAAGADFVDGGRAVAQRLVVDVGLGGGVDLRRVDPGELQVGLAELLLVDLVDQALDPELQRAEALL